MKFPADKEQMVLDNMGLVMKIARSMAQRFKSPLVDFDDLMQVGSMGLMRAVETFDESKGFKFSTFAYRTIQGYIMRELHKSTPIRAPVYIVILAGLILKRGQQDEPISDLAIQYKQPESAIISALDYLDINVTSADRSLKYSEDESVYNLIPVGEDYDEIMIVKEFLDYLNPRDRDVLLRLMDGKLASEIAEELGIHRQRIYTTKMRIREEWLLFESGEVVEGTKGRPRKTRRTQE